MTSIDTPMAPLARAAALLDAIARDSELAVDFEVPLRCGQAANRLHTLLGATSPAVPYLGDHEPSIRAALGEAIALLSMAPEHEDHEHEDHEHEDHGHEELVFDALVQARAAAIAVRSGQAS